MKTLAILTIAMAWLNPKWKEQYRDKFGRPHKPQEQELVEVHNVPDSGSSFLLLSGALCILCAVPFVLNSRKQKA